MQRWTRFVALALAVSVGAVLFGTECAEARTFFVSPTGSGTSGTSSSPCALSYANCTVAAGDVVMLFDGTYTVAAVPNCGDLFSARNTKGQFGARITYIGNLASPSSVILNVPNNMVRNRYITIKGVTFTGDLNLQDPYGVDRAGRDSVYDCVIQGGFYLYDADSTVLSHCHLTGPNALIICNVYNGGKQMYADSLIACTMNLLPVGGGWGIEMNGDIVAGAFLVGLVMDSCQVTVGPSSTGNAGVAMYCLRQAKIKDTSWLIDNGGPAGHPGVLERDGSAHNLFLRDTVTIKSSGGGNLYMRWSHPGGTNYFWTEIANRYDHCIFKNLCNNNPGIEFATGVFADTLDHSIFVSNKGPGLYIHNIDEAGSGNPGGVQAGTLIDHCTIIGGDDTNGAMWVETPWPMGSDWAGALTVKNSIFYSRDDGTAANGDCAERINFWDNNGGSYASDNNVFYRAATSSNGSAVRWSLNKGVPTSYSVGSNGQLCTTRQLECSSRYGDPRFANTNFETFDAHLLPGSAAIGAGEGGSDCGATGVSFVVNDSIRPAPITLSVSSVSDTSATLAWTAVGDDSLTGRASAYDIRYSTSPITDGTWGSAVQAIGEPVPALSGTPQTFVLRGLRRQTTYYFSIRAIDKGGNASALSNSPSAITPDTTPPAKVNDLAVGFIWLSWNSILGLAPPRR